MSDLNKYWVLQICVPIINTLNKINKRKNVKRIFTYDFSALFTKLPQNKLLDELFQQMDFVFQGGNKTFIKVSTKGKAFC